MMGEKCLHALRGAGGHALRNSRTMSQGSQLCHVAGTRRLQKHFSTCLPSAWVQRPGLSHSGTLVVPSLGSPCAAAPARPAPCSGSGEAWTAVGSLSAAFLVLDLRVLGASLGPSHPGGSSMDTLSAHGTFVSALYLLSFWCYHIV